MKCKKCDVTLISLCNADCYVCHSCKMAFSGIDFRANFNSASYVKWFKEGEVLYKTVLEKIKSGEYI
jgi:ribosomal protein L37AE/L43A